MDDSLWSFMTQTQTQSSYSPHGQDSNFPQTYMCGPCIEEFISVAYEQGF